MVARRAQHVLVGEQAHVDQLGRRVGSNRWDGAYLVCRKVGRQLRLGRQAQLIAAQIERGSCLAQVEHVRGGNHREAVSSGRAQHDSLGGLLRRVVRRPCLGRGGLDVGMLEQLRLHTMVAEVAFESRAARV